VIVPLLSEVELQNLFVKTETTRCPIETFELLKPDEAALAESDSLYSLLDVQNRVTNDIQVDSTVVQTDGTVTSIEHHFKIKAIAEGGASQLKDVKVTLIVCGWEQLSLVNQDPLSHTLIVRDNVTQTVDLLQGLFVTNDTFCPPTTFVVRADDADLPTSTNLTSDQSLNAWIEGSELKLYARDPGSIDFWVQAITITDKHVNQPATLINNCGPNSQDIWRTTAGVQEKAVAKNLQTIELYSAAAIHGMFQQIDPTRCEIEKFEVFDSPGGTLLAAGDLYDVLDLSSRSDLMSGLNIDTNVAMTDGTVIEVPHNFAIRATAKGGFEQWKLFETKIVVCGFEELSAVDPAPYTNTLDIGPAALI